MTTHARTVMAALACLALAAPALAQETEDSPRSGFWFRGNLGGGSALFGSDLLDISGGGTLISLSFGKFLNDDVVLFADVHGAVISAPTLEAEGRSVSTSDDFSATTTGIGVGIAYYIVPNSVFLGGAVGMQTLRFRYEEGNRDIEGSTDPGVGGSLILGKDFVISDKWLLGAAGHAMLGTMKDQGGGPTWTTRAYGLSFTFTYAAEGWRR